MEKKKFNQLRFIVFFVVIAMISNTVYVTYHSEQTIKDYHISFAEISGSKNAQKYGTDKDKKPNDSVKAGKSDEEKALISKNGNENQHLPVPKGEVYTAEIDSYVPLLLIIAIALIFYYSRSKKNSSH